MSNDVECPYCDSWNEINHDDGYGYEEGKKHRQECWNCGKMFAFETAIIFSYDAFKADCLNGGEHEWEPVWHAPRVYPDWKRCKHCGEENKGDFIKENING